MVKYKLHEVYMILFKIYEKLVRNKVDFNIYVKRIGCHFVLVVSVIAL